MRGRTEPARLDAGAVGRIGRRRGDRADSSYATGGSPEQEGYEGAVVQRRILLASDLSARCVRAFDRAVLLARAWRARLTIATALEDWTDDARCESRPRWRRIDREMVDAENRIRDDLQGKDIDDDIVVRRARSAELIVELACERPNDLIVTGIAREIGRAHV